VLCKGSAHWHPSKRSHLSSIYLARDFAPPLGAAAGLVRCTTCRQKTGMSALAERTMEASQVLQSFAQTSAGLRCALGCGNPLFADGTCTKCMFQLQEELQNAKIPLGYRDFCAHLLVPLNACRRKELYLPWKCEHERHAYEKCEYLEYKRRLKHVKET